ncbi:MAG TPA: sugar phosphate isomerase/epimerase family protein [Planctomycetota bacterium]|jgi:sugar phosphate isomerase/epimerase
MTRRDVLKAAMGAGALAATGIAPVRAEDAKKRFRIGACDWSLGKSCSVDAFTVAKEIGLDGVQVSPGASAAGVKLKSAENQQKFKDAAKASGVDVASLALGELNSVPFKKDPKTIEWVSDSIDIAQAFGVKTILLAFFGNDDLRGDKEGVDETVKRLKDLAPKAEKAGISLGIESWLSGEEQMAIIERVGSPAVKVYYDVCNSTDRGYDIYKEIRTLGAKNICEVHCKENGKLLGKGPVDFKKVRAALDDAGYSGWLQIEGATEKGKTLVECYKLNLAFLREIFN